MVLYFTGAVMVPNTVCNGIYINQEVVKNTYQNYLNSSAYGKVDVQHDIIDREGVEVHSSYLTESKTLYGPAGTWVLCVKLTDEEIIQAVKEHKLNGYSIHGYMPTITCSREIKKVTKALLRTERTNKHSHIYLVEFDETGFTSKVECSEANNHRHTWNTSTCVTTTKDGHRHRITRPQSYKITEDKHDR